MKKLTENQKKTVLIAEIVGIFLFFALISHWTPVSGDDWVYAVGGMYNNPFVQAFRMYQTWSGRLLSELWGFLVAPHKSLWNLLNPLFFVLIFCLLVQLSGGKNHVISTAALAFLLMLCVANRLRMQTYTWIMGTTYVIPLLLFLVLVMLMKRWVFEDSYHKWTVPVLCILNFCIPLYMENAAALVCGADLLILIYLYIIDKVKFKQYIMPFVFGIAGTLIILLSPGASLRMVNDNAVFNSLSIVEKLSQNWPQFLFHTFTESNWITSILYIVFTVWCFFERKNHADWIIPLIFTAGFLCLSNPFVAIAMTSVMILQVIRLEKEADSRWFMIFLILCAIGADAVMMVSPIFDSRSALYTVYLWILLTITLFERIKLNKALILFPTVFVLLIAMRMYSYYEIYHLVHMINIRRNQQIEYYRVRPDAGDAWLLAYPDESIHSPNVLEGDDTHMYYFKEYYYLNQDLHLIFYYLDDYNAETIFEGQSS